MVPRDWFSRGLLEDLKYFNPFGVGRHGQQEGQPHGKRGMNGS